MKKNSTNLIHGRCTADFSHIYYLLVFRILCCSGSPLTFYFVVSSPLLNFFPLKIQYSQIMMFLRLRLCFVLLSLSKFSFSQLLSAVLVSTTYPLLMDSKSTFSALTFNITYVLYYQMFIWWLYLKVLMLLMTQQGQISSGNFLPKWNSLLAYICICLFFYFCDSNTTFLNLSIRNVVF